jgi:outer membrane immunogenic protein
MKKFLAAGFFAAAFASAPAFAADMPVKAAPMAAAPTYGWTGCYLGGNIGGIWAHTASTGPGGDGGSRRSDGVLGGGQIGCDYQVGSWVVGARGLFDWADASGHNSIPGPEELRAKVHYFGTATARLGYLLDPASLIYIKGGAAWMRTHHEDSTAVVTDTANSTRLGYDIGGGYERMIAPNWSAFIEYDYADFGTKRVDFSGGGFANIGQRAHVVLIGLNYRFATYGKAPVVAKY